MKKWKFAAINITTKIIKIDMHTKIKQSLITFIFLLFTYSLSYSQTVYEPITSDVYPYLEKMAAKGLIEFNDLIKPVSRDYIYSKLLEINKSEENISAVDKKENGKKVDVIAKKYHRCEITKQSFIKASQLRN